MSMRVSLLSLYAQDSGLYREVQMKVLQAAPVFFQDAGAFVVANDQQQLFQNMMQAFASSEVIVLCAPQEEYLGLKSLLLQVLNLQGTLDAACYGYLTSQGIPADVAQQQAAIPQNAVCFHSADMLYSGYAVKEGPQHFILLPLDADRIDSILFNGFGAYLTALDPAAMLSATPILQPPPMAPAAPPVPSEPPATPEPFTLQAQIDPGAQAPALPVESVAPTEPVALVHMLEMDTTQSLASLAKETVTTLFAENISVCVEQGPHADTLFFHLQNSVGYDTIFSRVDCDMEIGLLEQKNYTAILAQTARQLGGTTLGVTISQVFDDEANPGGQYVYVCVADSTFARVLRIFTEPQESAQNLVECAVRTVLDILNEYAANGKFVIPPQAVPPEVPPKKKLRPVMIAIGVLVAVLVMSLVVYYAFAGDLMKAFGGGGASGETTTGETTEAETLDPVEMMLHEQLARESDTEPQQTQAGEEPASVSDSSTGSAGTSNNAAIAPSAGSETGSTSGVTGTKNNTSTSKPTTTTKPTTKKETTTVKPPSSTGTAVYNEQSTFSFVTYGYGHGVGLSQDGAIALANNNKNYTQIIKHYFPTLSLITDASTPTKVTYGGTSYSIVTYLARTTQAEIGSYSTPTEAIKAQVVVAYTFAKSRNFNNLNANAHAFSSGEATEKTVNAVLSVLGMQSTADTPKAKYIATADNKAAFTPYFASSAGNTTSSKSVWGGSYAYLTGGIASPEKVSVVTKTVTVAQFRKYVSAYNKKYPDKTITLQSNPNQWIKILSHDSCKSSSLGYITEIQVGNRTMRGYQFRYDLMQLDIRSHCFSFTLNA